MASKNRYVIRGCFDCNGTEKKRYFSKDLEGWVDENTDSTDEVSESVELLKKHGYQVINEDLGVDASAIVSGLTSFVASTAGVAMVLGIPKIREYLNKFKTDRLADQIIDNREAIANELIDKLYTQKNVKLEKLNPAKIRSNIVGALRRATEFEDDTLSKASSAWHNYHKHEGIVSQAFGYDRKKFSEKLVDVLANVTWYAVRKAEALKQLNDEDGWTDESVDLLKKHGYQLIKEVFGAGHAEVALSHVTNTPHKYDKEKSWYQNDKEKYEQMFEDAFRILVNSYHYSDKKLAFVKDHFTIEGDDLVTHNTDKSGFVDRWHVPVTAQRLARKIDDIMIWQYGEYAQGHKFEE